MIIHDNIPIDNELTFSQINTKVSPDALGGLELLLLPLCGGRLRGPRVDLVLALQGAQLLQVALRVLQDPRLGNLERSVEEAFEMQS